jgi:hypothetical protein
MDIYKAISLRKSVRAFKSEDVQEEPRSSITVLLL